MKKVSKIKDCLGNIVYFRTNCGKQVWLEYNYDEKTVYMADVNGKAKAIDFVKFPVEINY